MAIRWFAKNRVAANLLMFVIVVGGATSIYSVKQEVFPEFSLDLINIAVPYLGAAPEEVEEGVCVRIEEAIQGLDGIKKVTSVASEGRGVVNVELLLGADAREVLDDVKSRVDAIDTFPAETEKPIITEVTNRRQVIDVAVSGAVDERTLRYVAEQVRDELSAEPGITLVELTSVRPYEVAIEVSEDDLRRHGLTFDLVANAVRRSSLDLPGGSVKTEGGEILLRTKGQAYRGPEFERLVLLTRPDGSHLELGDVAEVVDGFADIDQSARFDGDPTAVVRVFRVGNQDALGIADSVQAYIERTQPRITEGIHLTSFNDGARILRGRRDLLVRNAATGLVLVFASLALFLRFRLAFWVAVGLFIAFMGAFWVMPWLDVSINVISLFAFILVLGIVVDDAIVVGENIYTQQHKHGDGLKGSIEGAQQVALPVTFAVLTTVAAFLPLLAIAGTMGKVMRVIPLIVIPCLIWSLVESMWILPAHLSHYRHRSEQEYRRGLWHSLQSKFADGVQSFIRRVYRPLLELALEWRYVTLAIGVATLLLTVGLVRGGYLKFVFFPDVEADFISAAVTMPPGTPAEATGEAILQLEEAAQQVQRELKEEHGSDQFKHFISAIGEQPFQREQTRNAGGAPSQELFAHLGELTVELTPAEERSVGSAEVVQRWREAAGAIPDAIEVNFSASLFSAGNDIEVQLTGPDLDELRSAAAQLKQSLGTYAGVFDITDSFRAGKQEVKLAIKPRAEMLGLSLADLGRQVRQAFYGEEAQRIQRGRDDVRVMVRYPAAERRSLADLEQMWIRTPGGDAVPFSEVAQIETGRGYASINRVDRRRSINVAAAVNPSVTTAGEVIADMEQEVLPDLILAHPRIRYSYEGQAAEQRDTITGLARGFSLALVMIFALLAVPLRSYLQPLIIMSAIPFGLVGAVWGHLIMDTFFFDFPLTILSMFGLVALTGVVINDSLVMVDFINRKRETGLQVHDAIREAGAARFRPILLTSLTTFLGLAPLIFFEKSMQARFLIPMAVSLSFGVVFATFITLMLIPCGYAVLEDINRLGARVMGRRPVDAGERSPDPPAEPAPAAGSRPIHEGAQRQSRH